MNTTTEATRWQVAGRIHHQDGRKTNVTLTSIMTYYERDHAFTILNNSVLPEMNGGDYLGLNKRTLMRVKEGEGQ